MTNGLDHLAPPATPAVHPAEPRPSRLVPTIPGVAFHRLLLAGRPHPRWWRPLLLVVVAVAISVALFGAIMLVAVGLGVLVPGLELSATMDDPHNPLDMLVGFGGLAVGVPAVALAHRVTYGSTRALHSVQGRFRWGLLGHAARVVVPVLLALNTGAMLLSEEIALPPLTPGVVVAWALLVLLVPLQSAAEEYVFRALPLQVLGSWVRTPWLGIILPIPLFTLGHGYDWRGQLSVALFALAMGLLTWKSGGIELAVLLHAANNWALGIAAPLVPGSLGQGEITWGSFALSTGPMLLLTALLWVWVSRRAGLGLWEPVRDGRVPESVSGVPAGGARLVP